MLKMWFVVFVMFAQNAEAIVIKNDNGGQIIRYLIKSKRAESISIFGRCYSACTVYLAHENVCIGHGAEFYFHAPFGTGSAEADAKAKTWLLGIYPKWVRAYINRRGGLSKRWIVMQHKDAAKFVKGC